MFFFESDTVKSDCPIQILRKIMNYTIAIKLSMFHLITPLRF